MNEGHTGCIESSTPDVVSVVTDDVFHRLPQRVATCESERTQSLHGSHVTRNIDCTNGTLPHDDSIYESRRLQRRLKNVTHRRFSPRQHVVNRTRQAALRDHAESGNSIANINYIPSAVKCLYFDKGRCESIERCRDL